MTRLDLRSIGRLLLAHHPVCHPFRDDVFRVGPVRLCVGCWTTYPVALLVLGLLVLTGAGGWLPWLMAGLGLCAVQLLSAVGWTTDRARKVAVKAVLGVGMGMAVYGILAAPLPLGLRVAALGVCATLAAVTMLPRGRRLVRTCEGCFFKGDWERCPGMALVRPSELHRPRPPQDSRPQQL